jgi:uncharacterized protein YcaQ
MDVMRDIRYLQLDPTSVVTQSHILVLWSRLGQYRISDLERLQWRERRLLESWSHAASVVLTEDWPLYLARTRDWPENLKGSVWYDRVNDWIKANQELRKHILDEIRRRGPLQSKDFEDRSKMGWGDIYGAGWHSSGWNKERNVSRMLDFLFHEGVIMVAGREGKQKRWDLTERVVPKWAPRDRLSETDVEYDGAQKSLRALGVATPRQIRDHFLSGRYPNIETTLHTLQDDGKVVPATISDPPGTKESWFVHNRDLDVLEKLEGGDWEPRTTLLSPFDNLIIDRNRTHELFGYFFRIEIYTRKERRKTGFFVMSILDGDKIIGRIDPVMDRKDGTLRLNAVHAEPSAPKGRETARRITGAVEDLAEFLGAKQVAYPRSIPEPWRGYLR